MVHDLTYEKRLLDMLGYTIEEKEDKWIIKDDKDKEVGYIKYGPFDYDKRDCRIIYFTEKNGYHMVIDSDTISYNSARDIDHKIYMFNVKGVGEVSLRLGKKCYDPCTTAQFELFSEIYGLYSIEFDDRGYEDGIINSGANSLRVEYYYHINGYDVLEHTHLRNGEYSNNNAFKAYEFALSYNKEDEKFNCTRSDGKELFAYTVYNEPQQTLYVSERDYKTNDSSYRKENKTVEEFVIEDGRGIELFKRLRKLTNEILPFKIDIFYEIIKDKIEEYGIECFLDEEDIKKLNK